DKFAHEILDVPTDIAGLRKFRGIPLYKWNADEIGDTSNQVGFADAGGAHEDDILLGVIRLILAFHGQSHVVVVIAHGDTEHLFGFLLPDDEAIEILLYIARFFLEKDLRSFGFLRDG